MVESHYIIKTKKKRNTHGDGDSISELGGENKGQSCVLGSILGTRKTSEPVLGRV